MTASRARSPAKTVRPGAVKGRRPYLAAEERRRRIIAAAQQVFAQTSLQGARTRDLARAARTSQATLFEHFKSKEALFEAAVVEPLLTAMRGMNDRARSYESARSWQELDQLGRASAETQVDLMLKIFPFFTAALFSDLAAGRRLYEQQISPLLSKRAGTMRPLIKDGLDPQFVELAVFGMHFALAMDQVFAGRRWQTPDLIDQMAILFSSGFLKDPQSNISKSRAKKKKATSDAGS
jgi:AcrR family transcriptional regulator